MNYAGVDLHKERSWFYVMDEHGKRLDSQSIANLPGASCDLIFKDSSPIYCCS